MSFGGSVATPISSERMTRAQAIVDTACTPFDPRRAPTRGRYVTPRP